MVLQQLYKRHYDNFYSGQMHISALLADLLCWCRNSKVWAKELVEQAAAAADCIAFSLPDDWTGHSFEWNTAGQTIEEIILTIARSYDFGEDESTDEEPELETSNAVEFYDERASYFDAVLRDFNNMFPDATVVDLVKMVLSDLTVDDFLLCVMQAPKILNLYHFKETGKPAAVICSDEWYAYDDLVAIFDDEGADSLLLNLGYNPSERPSVSGTEIVQYVHRNIDEV